MVHHEGRGEALDLQLLARQTLGDAELEAELFELFEVQAERLFPHIAGQGDRGGRSDAAHSLRGAAAAVGAVEVMRLAGELELALGRDGPEPVAALAALKGALSDARDAIRAWRIRG